MIVSIASGKRGTGKTTIAVNLALSLPKGTVQLIAEVSAYWEEWGGKAQVARLHKALSAI